MNLCFFSGGKRKTTWRPIKGLWTMMNCIWMCMYIDLYTSIDICYILYDLLPLNGFVYCKCGHFRVGVIFTNILFDIPIIQVHMYLTKPNTWGKCMRPNIIRLIIKNVPRTQHLHVCSTWTWIHNLMENLFTMYFETLVGFLKKG